MAVLEDVLRYHGNPGRCQMVIWFLVLFNLFHMGMIQQFNIVMSYIPKHKCKEPSQKWLDNQGAEVNGTFQCSVRLIYGNATEENATEAEDVPCPEGWDYNTRPGEVFPATEFNMVCNQNYLLSLAVSVTFIGVMCGGLVFGTVADLFGRQKSMAFIVTALSILNTSVYFVPDYSTFVTVRFFMGIFSQGLQTTCLAYGSELFLPRMRTLTSSAVGILWALILPILAFFFYVFGHWRLVHLGMGILSLLSAVYVWFLPESVAWLLSKGKLDTAAEVLDTLARRNGILPSPTLMEDLQQVAESIRRKKMEGMVEVKFMNLIKTPTLRRITLSLLYIWFTIACVIFGLSFSISSLKGDIYVTYVITGTTEVVLRSIVMYIFFLRYGRIKIMSIGIIACGILTIAGYLAKYYTPESYEAAHYVITAIAVLGRNLVALNFTVMCIYTAEIFPTALRSTGIGLGLAAARFGNIVTPFILFLLGTMVWPPLPQLVYGTMTLGAGFLVLTLPETFNQPLPATQQDVEDLVKKNKKKISKNCDFNDAGILSSDDKLHTIIFRSVKDLAVSFNK